MTSRYARATGSLSASSDALFLVLRVVMGVLMIDHGLQKFHGKGGLTGFEYFLKSLKNVPVTGLTSHLVPMLEVGGGVLLIVGLLTRVLALLFTLEMLFTGFIVKMQDLHTGLVAPIGAGAEVDFVFLLVFLTLLLAGPGRLSLDTVIGLEGHAVTPVTRDRVPAAA